MPELKQYQCKRVGEGPARKRSMFTSLLPLLMLLMFLCPVHTLQAQDTPTPAPAKTQEPEKTPTPDPVTQKTQTEDHTGGKTNNEANTGTPQKDPLADMPLSGSASLLQTLLALCFVLGLIFLATYFFKKITGIKSPQVRRSQVPINIVGNRPLGDKKYLSIVEIQGKHYFLGVTSGNINLLSELQLELDLEGEQGAPVEVPGFEALFRKAGTLLNRGKKS